MTDSVPQEVEELLTSEPLPAYLATCRDERPHVAPVWYRYTEGTIELVTTGRKLENVRANPRVSISVQKEDGGIPSWTVTLLGIAEVVEDEAANREANRRINRKYGVEDDAWAENTLVRVEIGSVSYRTY